MNSEPEFASLRVACADGVAHLTLDRPERRNAIDLTTSRALFEAAHLPEVASARCVLITGTGPHFCVGGDLGSFGAESDLPDHLLAVAGYGHAAVARLAANDAPLVVAVNGHVAGAGLGIALLADVLLAEEGTTFRTAYAELGLTPDGAVTQQLPLLIGPRRAQRMILLGHVLEAAEAVEWGLCTEVVPAGRLAERAAEVAARLAAGPTRAYGETTRLLRQATRRGLAEHLEDEATTLRTVAATADAAEGIAAFTERRAPRFEGR